MQLDMGGSCLDLTMSSCVGPGEDKCPGSQGARLTGCLLNCCGIFRGRCDPPILCLKSRDQFSDWSGTVRWLRKDHAVCLLCVCVFCP